MKPLRNALIFAFGMLMAGCGHAQVTPTSYQMDLSWVAPVPVAGGLWTTPCSGTGSSPCSTLISRATVTPGQPCPTPNTVTPNYSPLNLASPATGLVFTDSAVSGLNVCYIAQTEQAGIIGSALSNVAGPYAVPAGPGAPTLSAAPQVASAAIPATGNGPAPVLTAKLTAIYR